MFPKRFYWLSIGCVVQLFRKSIIVTAATSVLSYAEYAIPFRTIPGAPSPYQIDAGFVFVDEAFPNRESSNVYLTFSFFPEFCRTGDETNQDDFVGSVLFLGIDPISFPAYNALLPTTDEFWCAAEKSEIFISVAPTSRFSTTIDDFLLLHNNEDGGGVVIINPENARGFAIGNQLFYSRMSSRNSYSVRCIIGLIYNANRPTKSNSVPDQSAIVHIHPSSTSTGLPRAIWNELFDTFTELGTLDDGHFQMSNPDPSLYNKLPSISVSIELENQNSLFPILILPEEYLEPTTEEGEFKLLIHPIDQRDQIYLGYHVVRNFVVNFVPSDNRIGFGTPGPRPHETASV